MNKILMVMLIVFSGFSYANENESEPEQWYGFPEDPPADCARAFYNLFHDARTVGSSRNDLLLLDQHESGLIPSSWDYVFKFQSDRKRSSSQDYLKHSLQRVEQKRSELNRIFTTHLKMKPTDSDRILSESEYIFIQSGAAGDAVHYQDIKKHHLYRQNAAKANFNPIQMATSLRQIRNDAIDRYRYLEGLCVKLKIIK